MTSTSPFQIHELNQKFRAWTAAGLASILTLSMALAIAPAAQAEETGTATLAASRSVTVRDTTPNVPVLGERILAGGGRQTLLAFDLSSVPDDQIVVGASLRLYKVWGPSTTLVTSAVSTPWTEATTYSTRPTLGAEVNRTAVGATLNTWYDFDVLSAARAAHDDHAELSLHLNRSANQNASEFLSTRATDTSLRPHLVLTYRPLAEAMAEEAAALDVLAQRPIYQDLELPSTGAHGSSISWTSSDPSHLNADGVVTRPAGADATVTLTATLQQSGTTVEHPVEFTVRRLVDAPIERREMSGCSRSPRDSLTMSAPCSAKPASITCAATRRSSSG